MYTLDMLKDPGGDLHGCPIDLGPGRDAFRVGIDNLSTSNIYDPERYGVAVEIGDITDYYMSGGEELAYLDGTGVVFTCTRDEVVLLEDELDLVALQELDLV